MINTRWGSELAPSVIWGLPRERRQQAPTIWTSSGRQWRAQAGLGRWRCEAGRSTPPIPTPPQAPAARTRQCAGWFTDWAIFPAVPLSCLPGLSRGGCREQRWEPELALPLQEERRKGREGKPSPCSLEAHNRGNSPRQRLWGGAGEDALGAAGSLTARRGKGRSWPGLSVSTWHLVGGCSLQGEVPPARGGWELSWGLQAGAKSPSELACSTLSSSQGRKLRAVKVTQRGGAWLGLKQVLRLKAGVGRAVTLQDWSLGHLRQGLPHFCIEMQVPGTYWERMGRGWRGRFDGL